MDNVHGVLASLLGAIFIAFAYYNFYLFFKNFHPCKNHVEDFTGEEQKVRTHWLMIFLGYNCFDSIIQFLEYAQSQNKVSKLFGLQGFNTEFGQYAALTVILLGSLVFSLISLGLVFYWAYYKKGVAYLALSMICQCYLVVFSAIFLPLSLVLSTSGYSTVESFFLPLIGLGLNVALLWKSFNLFFVNCDYRARHIIPMKKQNGV